MLSPDLPIRTERLDLRPFAPRDLHGFHAYHRLPEVSRYLYTEPRDLETSQALVARKAKEQTLRGEGDVLSLAAVERASGRLVGDVILAWTSAAHRQGEIGYVFDPRAGGRGLATEAARALLPLAFDGLDLHRVVGRCDGRNLASARLLVRLGMRLEAHLVENEWVKGTWTDELVYALLAEEWRSGTQRTVNPAVPSGGSS